MHIDAYTTRHTRQDPHPWLRMVVPVSALGLALVAMTVFAMACSDDRAPLGPESENAARLSVAEAAGGPNAPALNGRIVFSTLTEAGNLDLFSMNPDGTDRRQLTTSLADALSPDVSPDGRRIVFTRREPGGKEEIYIMNADGSRLRKLTAFGPGGRAYDPAWSPDGKQIAFSGAPAVDNESDIYVMSANGRNVRPLTDFGPTEELDDESPTWSPDGQRIAFARFEGSSRKVMVMRTEAVSSRSVSVVWISARRRAGRPTAPASPTSASPRLRRRPHSR